jgi:PAS domain S-box-containing protein
MPGRNIKDMALLHALYDATVDAIVISDRSGTITGCNHAASALFGYGPEDLLGKNVKVLMPAGRSRKHDTYISNYIETGQEKIIGRGREVEGQHRDGRSLPLHLSIGKAEVAGDIHFVAIMHDLTERIAAQKRLEQAHQLEAVGRLTGGISHDFNNLLTIIIGNLELMQMQSEAAEFKELLSDALEAAELGANLTSRLLSYAGKSVLAPELLDVNAALDPDTLALLRRSLHPHHKLRYKSQGDIWLASMDPTQLQTAVLNLVLNAKDAMPKGGSIEIETRNVEVMRQDAETPPVLRLGKYVKISITDNGPGMPEHVLKRAFEPFFTTKPSGKGTGLGLPMVDGFVRQSGGHVEGRSEPDEGTSISLYFPAVNLAGNQVANEEGQVVDAIPVGSSQCVLVVEDDDKVRRLSIRQINELGFRTEEASSGEKALEILQNPNDIKIVFSVIVMPGIVSGYNLAEWIKTERPDIKVLLTSDLAGDQMDTQENNESGMSVLQKPYRQEDLARQLKLFTATG